MIVFLKKYWIFFGKYVKVVKMCGQMSAETQERRKDSR